MNGHMLDEANHPKLANIKLALNCEAEPISSNSCENNNQSNLEKPFGKNVIVMSETDQLKELHTILRDKNTSRNDFIFYADRLIRLVVEAGLNQLPCEAACVITPTGHSYNGVKFTKGNCGVSIMRSGEAMERGLRDCCRSIRIGKILIAEPEFGGAGGDQIVQSHDPESANVQILYAKLPSHIHSRNILLMYPILYTGHKILKAIRLLKTNGVQEAKIILLSLFATPLSVKTIMDRYSKITLLTSQIHGHVPLNFGQRYFGA